MSSDAEHRNPAHPSGSRSRPSLGRPLTASEFGRWHWWKDELTDYCRDQHLPVSGTKSMLIDRIARHLEDDAESPVVEVESVSSPVGSEVAAESPPSAEQTYLLYARRYFEDHPEATLREAWRSFKWARSSGRIPLPA